MSGSPGGVIATVSAGQTAQAQITGVVAGGCQLDLPVKLATARSFIHHDQRPALERAFAFGLTAPASGTGGPVPAPNRFLLLIGHTDQVGSVASNQSLSLRRANAVLAVFTVDATIWEANFQAEHWNGPNFEIATMSALVDTGGSSNLVQHYLQDTAARLDLFTRYLMALRPAWVPQSSPPVNPAMVTTPSPPVLGCGFSHPRVNTPGQANAENRRVEFFYFQSSAASVATCAAYPARQVTCGRFFTLQIELRDECNRPFTGSFDLTLPTGGVLTNQQTDAQGRYSRDNVPPGRVTVQVESWSQSGLVSDSSPSLSARVLRRVTASGTRLLLGGRRFRFFGTNAYYLLESAALGTSQITDFFRIAEGSGIKVVRTWAFNEDASKLAVTSSPTGSPANQVVLGAGINHLETVIDQAAQHGIYLILALANYNPDFGGISEYARRVGYTTTAPRNRADHRVEELFYTGTLATLPPGTQLTGDPRLQYRSYVSQVIGRFRTKTNILAWELINEPRAKAENDPSRRPALEAALLTWLGETAAFIKSLNPPQLLSLGGVDAGTINTVLQSSLVRTHIDLVDTHLYPENFGLSTPAQARTVLQTDLAAASTAGKPFYLGEHGLARTTSRNRPQEYGDWATDLLSGGAAGMLFWQLVTPTRPVFDEFEISADLVPIPQAGPLRSATPASHPQGRTQPSDGPQIVDFVNRQLSSSGPTGWSFC